MVEGFIKGEFVSFGSSHVTNVVVEMVQPFILLQATIAFVVLLIVNCNMTF